MAKIFLLLGCLCVTPIAFAPLFAENPLLTLENKRPSANECDAPAPTNFHVTNIGIDFMSLAWIPAWVGALHTLEVAKENSAGGWDILYTNYAIPGDAYTAGSLSPGRWRFTIATNCASGEASHLTSVIFEHFKIIDLVTGGRVPKNPSPVADCAPIDYYAHEWVGFKVTEIATGAFNLFELNIESTLPHPRLKRVFTFNPIVAVDGEGDFPMVLGVVLDAPVPFRVFDINDGDPDNLIEIGYIDIPDNGNPSIVNLCKKSSHLGLDWKPEYLFTPLTAEEVHKIIPSDFAVGGQNNGFDDAPNTGQFYVQNPVAQNLKVFAVFEKNQDATAQVQLFNQNGQLMIEEYVNFEEGKVSIPLESLSPSIYILRIEMESESKIFKIFKSE